MRIFKTGEKCRVTYAGRTVDAVVRLASPNGRSLFLEFEAMLGGFVGAMPVLFDDGEFRPLMGGGVAKVAPRDAS